MHECDMAKIPTAAQRKMWDKVTGMGCFICGAFEVEIHHAFTGGGGRKDHDKVLPLCYDHHRGAHGIHTLGRKRWVFHYGSEQDAYGKVLAYLALEGVNDLIG